MLDRRRVLSAGAVTLAGAAAACATTPPEPPAAVTGEWKTVGGLFDLDPAWIDMSAMLITAHPRPVRQAIELYRQELDRNPVLCLTTHNRRRQNDSRRAAGAYLGVPEQQIALTDSTTQGVALVYHGLRLRPGQEVLTTDQDYYVTHESLRLAAERNGALVRRTPMYEHAATVSDDALAERIVSAVAPRTRVVALTWVHSSTGVKTPVRLIADRLAALNAGRHEQDQVLLAVDGVHGFGNQDETLGSLGCDYLMAGCHKWLFGPRGTGIIAATPRGLAALRPTVPSFLNSRAYGAWITGEPVDETTGSLLTPGGFKAFEHLWAMPAAFALHEQYSKGLIAARTAELAGQLKEGLSVMPHVVLHTPMSPRVSAGIVAFDVQGIGARAVVDRLKERKVLASVAPYARPHVRLTPSIRNSPAEVERALSEVRALAAV